MNNATNHVNNLAIGLQSFLTRGYNNREDARRDVFGEARIKETRRFRRLIPVAPTLDEISKGSQLYLFVRKTLTGLFPPMGESQICTTPSNVR